jgi:opacity protein-like surface antigen
MGWRVLAGVLLASGALGQELDQFQAGAVIGYGFYRNGTIFSNEGTAKAGIRNRFAAGILLGYDFQEYVSCEFRYLYHDGHPFLEAPGTRVDIQGQSQALTGVALFHFHDRRHRWRPYVLAGAGAKGYIVAGPEPFPQPVPQIASLAANDVWKVVFNVGGGVKFRPRDHLLLRVEFVNYLTTFPRTQLVPAPHNTARGIFQQFTPLFGVSYTFHRR